jgi:hypothetical protein
LPEQLQTGETGGGGVRVGMGFVVGIEVGILVGDIVRVDVGVFVAVDIVYVLRAFGTKLSQN